MTAKRTPQPDTAEDPPPPTREQWDEWRAADSRPRAYIRLGSRGQVVIPAEMRKFMGLCEGDTFHATIDKDGQLILRKVPTDPIERLREAAGGAFDGIDATAWVRALRDEWDR
jgi:AbrB family looped-hinge helix DNA binding protein